jgi:hypothetical protein
MTLTLNYLRSLLLASALSFIAPVTLVGSAIALFLILGYLPGFAFSQAIATQIVVFLQTFGNGNAWEGTIVIGCACALVGGLFDTYIFTITTSDAIRPSSSLTK